MMLRTRHRHLIILAGLLLLAYGIRIYRLDYQSIWWDEGISLHLGTSSTSEIISDRLDNIHPPLYFFILKSWLSLVGVSAFTGRYLSLLASLGQVAITFSAVRWWAVNTGRRSRPWLALALILISPLSIIYGQEIRVYALLPLVYMAMLLLAEKILSADWPDTRLLISLAVVEWVGLHLHYIALFGVAYISVWGAVVLWRQHERRGLGIWVLAHALVAAASLPWLAGILGNWATVSAEANAGTFTTEAVPLPYLFAQVWAFHLTGLAGALASRFVQVGAALTAAMLVVLLLLRLPLGRQAPAARNDGRVTLRLVLHWLLPLMAGLVVWSVRSFSHPRYITMFAILLVPLATFLMIPARRLIGRSAALIFGMGMVTLSLWGLRQYFYDPGAAKPDMRGVAQYLENVTAAGDLILIPDTDWSLPFEFRGPAYVAMPHLDESSGSAVSHLARVLNCFEGEPCAESGRVFIVDYSRGTRDWQNRLPFELARRGHWVSESRFEDLVVREYRLAERPDPMPECQSSGQSQPGTRFDGLKLDSVWVQSRAAADSAVAVAICWLAVEPLTRDYTVSLVLRDPVTGERLAQTDTPLVDPDGAPTGYWIEGQEVISYHVLPLPAGTPPIEADLAASIYATEAGQIFPVEAIDDQNRAIGELIPIGPVILGPSSGLPSPPDRGVSTPPLWNEAIDVAAGLQLLGARFAPGPYRPGQTIRVGLTWRSTSDSLPDYSPVLLLEQTGQIITESRGRPANDRYPTVLWREGETVFEYRDIRIPADAEGRGELSISVDGNITPLGEITVEGADEIYERPLPAVPFEAHFDEGIALIGFDPPSLPLMADTDFSLTLYWESLTGHIERSYSVFTHLLAEDGRLIAQHDSGPANGQRPTDEWLPGEFVIDPHLLTWRDPTYTGEAYLAVGLYDPDTGERLRTSDGRDSITLPLAIPVEREE